VVQRTACAEKSARQLLSLGGAAAARAYTRAFCACADGCLRASCLGACGRARPNNAGGANMLTAGRLLLALPAMQNLPTAAAPLLFCLDLVYHAAFAGEPDHACGRRTRLYAPAPFPAFPACSRICVTPFVSRRA